MSEREELKKLRVLVRDILEPLMKGTKDIDPKEVATLVLQRIGADAIKTDHPLAYLLAHHFLRNIAYAALRGRPGSDSTAAQPELPFPDFDQVRSWYPRAHKKGEQAKWAPVRELELADAKWNVANWDREIDPMVEHKRQFIQVCVNHLGFPASEFEKKKDGGDAVDVG